MQEAPYRNRLPSEYFRYLCQFPEKKLKAMQEAFLTGYDLLPYLEGKSFSYTDPTRASYEEFYMAIVPLTTAVCWSLAAPEALNLEKGKVTINTATKNNRVLESWESATRPPPGPFDSVVQGEHCALVGWMKDWKGSSEHLSGIKMAISDSQEELGRDKFGVRIVGHADFGLKRVGWPSTEKPAIPYDRPVPLYYRSLVVVNESSEPVVLLDVCGVPSNDETFSLKDDFGLAHHYDLSKEQNQQILRRPETSYGVILQAGAEYQVMVELRCSPQDIAWHQQWLLFMFGRGGFQQHDHNEVFAIGRRVSALVGHNVQDVRSCLSTEAKPFYPAYLRQLFDTRPTEPKAYTNLKSGDWRKRLDAFEQTYVSSVWPLQLAKLEEALYCGVLTGGFLSNTSENLRPCACTVVQVRQFSRLLALEEAAMERDIKEHDLFNVQLTRRDASNFVLEVPGLPENRPSVFAGDLIYIRWERHPGIECAADVVAVEFQPRPQLTLRLPEYFLKCCPLLPAPLLVHVRFTFNRLVLSRMHRALHKVAILSMKLLPCICNKVTKREEKDMSISASPRTVEPSHISTRVEPPNSLPKAREFVEHRGAMKSLNREQWKAVTSVVDRVHGAGPYIILGPPGTGKTVTVVECVLQVLATDPSARLCVCAPSNYAADILCSGIAAGGVDRSVMWRMNDPRRIIASVKLDVMPFCEYQLKSEWDEMKSFRVIVCTCGAAGMLNEPPYLGKVEPFSHVFVDEAGQALLPEALIPLSLAHSNACLVLCGDPKQLGPVVHSRLATGKGLDDSLISRFEKSEEYHSNFGDVKSPVIKLVRNYRANAKLLELPSRMFYNNELIAAAQTHLVTPPKDWEELKGRDFPMLFYGVKGQQMREGESPSYFNPVEAGKVVDLISGLIAKTHISAGDIGVMAPYRRQVYKLRLVLRSKSLGAVRVGTVDDYQGQEEKIVFISTVLTRPESLIKVKADGKDNHIGFLGNAKRFNVAITRAKAMLVVVGHPLVLAQDENWSELLRYCLARDAFRGFGSQYVPPCLALESAWEAESEGTTGPDQDDTDHSDNLEALEIAKAIEKMAELSLLGMGHVDRLYPEDLDSMYSAFSEEMEWRVQL